jgi:hypothetical protein
VYYDKKKVKTYTKEFKEEAVALITEQGYSVAEPKDPSLLCKRNKI